MIRRPFSHSTPFYRGLSALLLILLLVAGCPLPGPAPQPGPQPEPKPSLQGGISLKKSQDLFNEAVKTDQPTVNVPAASRQKYQQVVDTLEKEVLGKVNKSLEVNAYALQAFSQWRLGNYAKAMEAGDRGRQVFETEKMPGNRRDYGMCLIVGGLCAASQTYKEYENLQAPVTKELAQNLTGRLEQAMRAIDSGNAYLDRQEDIAVYANLWQLALVDAAVRIWTSGLPRQVSRPEVCRWLGRADSVFAKFPNAAYHWRNLTETYKKKFEQKKKAECQGR